MAKRIVTKIGDVFCAEIDGKFKCYFQHIAIDKGCLGGATIRVFKKRYPLDYNPDIEDIVTDDVLFYADAMLRTGIKEEVWHKVGKSLKLGLEELEKIWFVAKKPEYVRIDNKLIDISDEWNIWQTNGTFATINSEELRKMAINTKMEPGGINPVVSIFECLKYGYYLGSMTEYRILNRVPREDVDSYTKLEEDGVTRYFHFYGADAVREIVTHGDEVICRLDTEHHRCGDQELRKTKFWDTNWQYYSFISQEEFDNKWNNLK